jgi:hypothetical protein
MIAEASAILGQDVGPWTLRELLKMVKAAQAARWARTASLMALVEVVNAGRRVRFQPNKWNPYTTSSPRDGGAKITKDSIGSLKALVGLKPKGRKRGRVRNRKSARERKRKDPQQ